MCHVGNLITGRVCMSVLWVMNLSVSAHEYAHVSLKAPDN